MAAEDPGRTERIRARDPAELEAVIGETLPALLRAARAAGLAPDRAEETVQSTFVTFIEKADRFDGRALARTWVFGILYRKISEARRGIAREQKIEDIDTVMEQRFDASGAWSRPPRPPDAGLSAEQVRRWIGECMEQLPERHRLASVLREVEGLSTEEICNVLGVTSNNLGVILYRGRNSLRECLEAKGMKGSSDAAL